MKLFLDACAIIYWVEMVAPYYNQFAEHLKLLRKSYPSASFAASSLSLLECRVKPLREMNKEILSAYQTFFTASNLTIVQLDIPVIEHATQLRAAYQIRTPDALQAACALSINDDVLFLTADAGFKKIQELSVKLI